MRKQSKRLAYGTINYRDMWPGLTTLRLVFCSQGHSWSLTEIDMPGKTLKGLINDITKAANASKFDKFLKLVGDLLALLAASRTKPKMSAKGGPPKDFPTGDELQDCTEALEAMDQGSANTPATGAKAGIFGGGLGWRTLIPIAVEFVKQLIDELAKQIGTEDTDDE